MISQQFRERYWRLVEASLNVLLAKDAATAKAMSKAERLRYDANESQSDLWYHDEPVNVAQEIAGQRIEWTPEKQAVYACLRAQAESSPSSSKTLNVSDTRRVSKSAMIRAMAEQIDLSGEQVAKVFDVVAATAVKETRKNGEFTIPGIGKLVKVQRKARTGSAPSTGKTVLTQRGVEFHVAKAANDAIIPLKRQFSTKRAATSRA